MDTADRGWREQIMNAELDFYYVGEEAWNGWDDPSSNQRSLQQISMSAKQISTSEGRHLLPDGHRAQHARQRQQMKKRQALHCCFPDLLQSFQCPGCWLACLPAPG